MKEEWFGKVESDRFLFADQCFKKKIFILLSPFSATYGTTKYCSFYLKSQPCQNPGCQYLHEPGEEADSFVREETIKAAARAKQHPSMSVLGAGRAGDKDESALPTSASWAKSTPTRSMGGGSVSGQDVDSDLHHHFHNQQQLYQHQDEVPSIDQYPSLAAAHELDKKKNSSQSMSGNPLPQRQLHQLSAADLVASPTGNADVSVPSATTTASEGGVMDPTAAIVPEFTESLFDIGFRLVMRYNGLLDPFADVFNLTSSASAASSKSNGGGSVGGAEVSTAAGGVRQKALDTVSRSRFDRMMGGENGLQLAGGDQPQYMVKFKTGSIRRWTPIYKLSFLKDSPEDVNNSLGSALLGSLRNQQQKMRPMGLANSPVTAGSPGLGGNVQQQRNSAAAAVNMTTAPMLRQQEQQMYLQVGGQQVFAQQYPQLSGNSNAVTGVGGASGVQQPDSDFLNQFLRESQFRAAQQQQQQQISQQVPFSDPAIMAAKMGEAARLRVFENVSTTSGGAAAQQQQQQWAQQQQHRK